MVRGSAVRGGTAPRAMRGAPDRVVVVGGGIAGISAALRLAGARVPVTLLETRKKLGGRATSFDDVRTGDRLDNCQHIVMGCCTNFLDLLDRLGVAGKIAWSRSIWWVERGGRRSEMKPGLTPAPVHFAGSFLRAHFLNPEEKLAIAAAMHVITRARLGDLEGITFAAYLDRLEQPDGAIEKFWAPIVASACNGWPDRVAASEAAHVLQEGFLAHRDAARIGVPTVPLVDLYDEAARAITSAGGGVRLGVSAMRMGPNHVETAGGERIEARAVICAVPFERALRIISPEVQRADERFQRLGALEHSPILGVHLVFDRPVLDLPHAALVGTRTQWVFRKDEAGMRVHAVVSAADAWMELPEEEIVARVVEDVRACFPVARRAKLISGRPVKEKRATFLPTVASIGARPATIGQSGVILAGDYVRTGWPSTMEGATRSGALAAAAALGRDPAGAVVPPLAPAVLYRAARALAGVG